MLSNPNNSVHLPAYCGQKMHKHGFAVKKEISLLELANLKTGELMLWKTWPPDV